MEHFNDKEDIELLMSVILLKIAILNHSMSVAVGRALFLMQEMD